MTLSDAGYVAAGLAVAVGWTALAVGVGVVVGRMIARRG